MERRLAAIMAADVVGYSRMIRADEEGTLTALKALRADLVDPKLAEHNGRIVKLMGDGMLAEFASVVDAVRAAVETQQAVAERNAELPEDKRIEFRVGINLGDVVIDGDDIHGDGVNVAARLEGMAEPGGICISDAVHDQVKNRMEASFADFGRQTVKNIDEAVRAWRWHPNTAELPAARNAPLARPDKPSIAVLPFDNMSRDPEQDYFAEGMAEDIITELSRMRGFFVIARNSSFVYKGRSVSISEVARELGVRYVLEGSVRRAGERVRITAQLIDGDNEAHIWAERYDRKLDDIFELQDEMTRQIVGAIEPSLLTAEAERSHRRPPENLDAWDYVARAMGLVWTWTADDNIAAEELLRKAIQIDSGYARAHSVLAVVLTGHLWYGRARKEDRPGDAALRSAQTALELDGGDPWGHMALGFVHGFRREPDDAIAEMEEALSLNPNFALAYGMFGLVLAWAGQTERSLDATDMAERLSPRDVINLQFAAIRGVALFAAADYEAAADQARRGIRKLPLAPGSYRVLASSLGQLGRREDARPVVDRLLELQPGITVAWARENIPVPPSDFLDRYVEGLRLAGIPES